MACTAARAAGGSGADGISSIVVERDRPGVSFGPRDRVTAARALPTCALRLDGVWVPADHRLGREGDGLRAALATIDLARAQVGAIATGLAQGTLDEAVAYARERRAFGRAIAEFQGLQFLLADLAAQVEAARWLAYRAAWLFDRRRPATRACAIAKRVGVDAAEEVARKALEVFGASGLRRDRPVERYLRWAKITAFIDGTPQVQQLVIARDLLRAPERGPYRAAPGARGKRDLVRGRDSEGRLALDADGVDTKASWRSGAGIQPRITDERPVVDALDGRRCRAGRRMGPPLARREPDELLRALAAIHAGRLDLGTTGAALFTLRFPRALGVLLGLALIFLAAAVAAVHPRPFLSHRTPFWLPPLYMTGPGSAVAL
jgi:acyl-CoA dehydrogenase-like protein